MTRQRPRFTDGPADLTFRVTNRAIAEGVPGDATSCIFAKGLCATRADITYAEIRPNMARVVFKDGRAYVYQTSRELRMGLRAFDAAGAAIVEPGIYSLLAPKGTRRIEYRRVTRAEHEARLAAGEARPYAPRKAPNRRVVAEARPVRSSVWGAHPTFVTGAETDAFKSRFPNREPYTSGKTSA